MMFCKNTTEEEECAFEKIDTSFSAIILVCIIAAFVYDIKIENTKYTLCVSKMQHMLVNILFVLRLASSLIIEDEPKDSAFLYCLSLHFTIVYSAWNVNKSVWLTCRGKCMRLIQIAWTLCFVQENVRCAVGIVYGSSYAYTVLQYIKLVCSTFLFLEFKFNTLRDWLSKHTEIEVILPVYSDESQQLFECFKQKLTEHFNCRIVFKTTACVNIESSKTLTLVMCVLSNRRDVQLKSELLGIPQEQYERIFLVMFRHEGQIKSALGGDFQSIRAYAYITYEKYSSTRVELPESDENREAYQKLKYELNSCNSVRE